MEYPLTPISVPSPQLLKQELESTVRSKWPLISRRCKETSSLSITADTVYRVYTKDQNPQQLFEKTTQFLDTVQSVRRTDEQDRILMGEIYDLVIRAIFGSNRIERAGLGLDITIHLCHQVFHGDPMEDIDEHSAEYTSKLHQLTTMDSSLNNMPRKDVLRGRLEIIQHAKAFQYIIHKFAVMKEDMTEQLIKDTHAILCRGVSILHDEYPDVSWESYAGIYRSVHVGAGSTMFVVPKFVPAKMSEMCANLEKDIRVAKKAGHIDPFSLAAKYSLNFVEIHPFQDGNGRLCRMMLNAIVFRYIGVVIPIGETEEDRTEYLDIKKRATKDMTGHGEYATFVLQKGKKSLRVVKQKLHGKK